MFTTEDIMKLPFFIDKKGHAIVKFPVGCVPRIARRARLMAWASGMDLGPEEIVHHRDENKANDDPKNFEIMLAGEHTSHHCAGKKQGGSFAKGNRYGSLNKGRSVLWGEKISKAKTGKALSAEHKAAISRSLLARHNSAAVAL